MNSTSLWIKPLSMRRDMVSIETSSTSSSRFLSSDLKSWNDQWQHSLHFVPSNQCIFVCLGRQRKCEKRNLSISSILAMSSISRNGFSGICSSRRIRSGRMQPFLKARSFTSAFDRSSKFTCVCSLCSNESRQDELPFPWICSERAPPFS